MVSSYRVTGTIPNQFIPCQCFHSIMFTQLAVDITICIEQSLPIIDENLDMPILHTIRHSQATVGLQERRKHTTFVSLRN